MSVIVILPNCIKRRIPKRNATTSNEIGAFMYNNGQLLFFCDLTNRKLLNLTIVYYKGRHLIFIYMKKKNIIKYVISPVQLSKKIGVAVQKLR